MKPGKGEKGFTLMELMIAMAVIAILSAIAVPMFRSVKDKAIFGAAKANVDVIRSVLASYAASDPSNRYPSSVSWTDFSGNGILGNANLSSTAASSKLSNFVYTTDGTTFTVSAKATNLYADDLTGTPAGVIPAAYPH